MNAGRPLRPFDWYPYHVGAAPGATEAWTSLAVQSSTAALSTLAVALNTLYAVPLLARGRSIDRMAWEVTTGGALGSVGRMGLYRSIGARNLYPGALIVDGGEVDTTVVRVNRHVISVPLLPDRLYWAVFLFGTAAATVRAATQDTVANIQPWGINGAAATLSTVCRNALTLAQAYGALPATFPAGAAFMLGGSHPFATVRQAT